MDQDCLNGRSEKERSVFNGTFHSSNYTGRQTTSHGDIKDEPLIIPCAHELRVKGPVDGSILLSVHNDVMLKLNSIGTLVWWILDENKESRTGLAAVDILDRLALRLETCVNEPVPLRIVQEDLEELLLTLERKRLVRVTKDTCERDLYEVAKGIIWSIGKEHSKVQVIKSDNDQPSLVVSSVVTAPSDQITTGGPAETDNPRWYLTLYALLGLTIYDLLLKIGGFKRIHRAVERCSLSRRKTNYAKHISEVCLRVCTAVDRAQMYYFKQVLCLQRSAVTTYILRRHGIEAEMVIAAHLMPFDSHAWVEVSGNVVNDTPKVQSYYDHIIERLDITS